MSQKKEVADEGKKCEARRGDGDEVEKGVELEVEGVAMERRGAVHLSQLEVGDQIESGGGEGDREMQFVGEMKARVGMLGLVMKEQLDDGIVEIVTEMGGVVLSGGGSGVSVEAISSLRNSLSVLGVEMRNHVYGIVECAGREVGELREENRVLKERLDVLEKEVKELGKRQRLVEEETVKGGVEGKTEKGSVGRVAVQKGSPVTPKTKGGGVGDVKSRLKKRRKEMKKECGGGGADCEGDSEGTGGEKDGRDVKPFWGRRVYEKGEGFPPDFYKMTLAETEREDANA
ncbi:hypothetical protein FGB62_65g20 [Gracilaria domingensis]|nr:hypothetical protein FGB62_65g20 [Gracilaria domingensis]